MKYAICITLLSMVGSSAVLAHTDLTRDAQKTAQYKEMLAEKECISGTPMLTKVRKTVMKTVAGRMIPTADWEVKVVCG